MRLLSKQEQALCWHILQGDGNNNYLANILDDYLDGCKHETDGYSLSTTIDIGSNPKAQINQTFIVLPSRPKPEGDALIDEAAPKWHDYVQRLLLEIVTLIELLEQEGYIILVQNTPIKYNFSLGTKLKSIGGDIKREQIYSRRWEVDDPFINKLLIEYNPKEIYVTEKFRVFCANGCIPRSDV